MLFGLFYFVQGLDQPSSGIVAQPVRSLLKKWGETPEATSNFFALLLLPWTIKPIYGLISDFIPLAGYHRKSYLLLTSTITTVCMAWLGLRNLPPGSVLPLFWLLMLPSISVAFSDVTIDALMVQIGQPLGLTGKLQAAQWGCIYAAGILTGVIGGILSANDWEQVSFLIASVATAFTLFAAVLWVRETRAPPMRESLGETWQVVRRASRSRPILAAAAFLFLWHFNPFLEVILYLYMTTPEGLGLSEQVYGYSYSVHSMAAMTGSFAYGFYCRRVPMRRLLHVAIVMGVISTLAYWAMRGEWSAYAVEAVAWIANSTGTMIQLDLAARVCPPRAAGTVFALLMSITNLATAVATWFGGRAYSAFTEAWGETVAFQALVGIAALASMACWLIVPFLTQARPDESIGNESAI